MNKPDLQAALRLFLIVFILLLFFASLLQTLNFEVGTIISQVLFILVPALLFWRLYRVDQVSFARLEPLRFNYVPIIFILSISMWLLNMVFAVLLMTGLMEIGYEPVVLIEPPRDFRELIVNIIAVAIFAGICEEVLFRGTIMPAIEKHGLLPAVIFSSLLFALFHGSMIRLISTFALGLVIAVIVIKTGSLWGGILYHILNNLYSMVYLFLSGQVETNTEATNESYLVLLPLFLIALVGLSIGLRRLQNKSAVEPLLPNKESWLPQGWLSWPMAGGLVIFLLFAFLELAVGFGWLETLSP